MKKIACAAAAVGLGIAAMPTNVNAALVINELYTFGAGSGATLNADYVELFNNGLTPFDLTGHTLQYGSATGNFASNTFTTFTLPSVSVPAGGFFLIQGSVGTGTFVALPLPPDLVTSLNMAQTAGKVRIIDGSSNVIDLVGYGTSTTDATAAPPGVTGAGFETARATSPTALLSIGRTLGLDTGNNSTDFTQQATTPTGSQVPEPASLGLIASAGALILGRRRK